MDKLLCEYVLQKYWIQVGSRSTAKQSNTWRHIEKKIASYFDVDFYGFMLNNDSYMIFPTSGAGRESICNWTPVNVWFSVKITR